MAVMTPLGSRFLPATLLISAPTPFHCRFLKTKLRAQFTNQNSGAAIVWFKHDLRIDDHPGIVAAASKYNNLVPLYVFDPRILSRFSDEMVELLLLAVEDLRRSLKAHGSNLMIRSGNVEIILRELVKEVKAPALFVEEEVEYDMRSLVATVEDLLAADPVLDWKPKIELWQTPFYDVQNLDDLPAFFGDVKKPQHNDVLLPRIPRLPGCFMELDWGHLPTSNDVGTLMDYHANRGKEQWYSIKHTSAEAVLRLDHLKLFKSGSPVPEEPGVSVLGNSSQMPNETQKNRLKNSVFGTSKGNIVAGGTEVVFNALAGYLRYLEGTARDDWQEVHQRLRETEIRTGASFGALFGSALQLGIISSRRVYYESIRYEKERNAGFLSPFGYSTTTVAAAIDVVCSIEWYRILSLKNLSQEEERYSKRLWRWNGHLLQYTTVGCEGPAVLLVHGFGAFFEHYRDNLLDIADGGNRVWALTLLGFGQSEKPNIVYSELMWAELLRDFIIEVVGEQAHLVGNSIGGYFISIVGGLWPLLVKSIALMNTAGDVFPGYSSLLFSKERQISGAAWLGSRALLQYLRFSLRSLVKSCYPARPERVNDWLIAEMLRASYDPGSAEVLESVFSFNLSIPLNYLLSRLKGKVLIIQGMKDPIANSGSKLAMFRKHCEGIIIKELDAATTATMLLLQHQKIVNSARHSKRWHLHWLVCQGLDLKTLVQRLRTSTSTGLQIPGGRLRGCVSESCLRNKKSPSENEETEFLKKFSKTLLEVKEDVQPTIVKGDKSKSVLFDACRLAKQLQLFGEKQWKTTSEVWVELLCYAAAVCCLPRSQIAQLGKGGELITFVWLLMAHYNLRFLQNQGFGWTKLIIHK